MSPATFWAMTPKELVFAARRDGSIVDGISVFARSDLARLIDQFPD